MGAPDRWRQIGQAALIALGLILPLPDTGLIRNLLLAAAVLAVLVRARQGIRWTPGPFAPGWLFSAAAFAFSAAVGINPSYSARELVGEFMLPFLVYAAAVNLFSPTGVRWFVRLFIAFGAGLGFYGLASSWVQYGEISFQYYHLEFLMDYKSYGTLLVFLLPYAFTTALRQPFAWAIVVLFVFNLIESYCRSAWFGVAVAAAAMVAYGAAGWRRRDLGISRRRLGITILTVLTVMVCGALLLTRFSSLATPLRKLVLVREGWENPLRLGNFRRDENIAARLRLWLNSARMVLDRPLFGYGPGIDNFRALYGEYKRPQDELIWHPHNEFYRALLEGGAFGFLAFLALLANVAYAAAARLRRQPWDWLTIAFALAAIGFLVRNQFDCHWLDDKVRLFWLLAGMTAAVWRSGPRPLLLVTTEWAGNQGGIGRVTAELARHLPTAEVVVPVLCHAPAANRFGRWRAALMTLVRIGEQQPVGLIALKWRPEGRVVRVASKLYRIPYLVYVHGKEILGLSAPDRRALRAVAECSRRVVAVSDATAVRLEANGIARERIAVLHNGTTTIPDEELRAPRAAEPVILAVGRLVRRKGFHHLVAAMPALASRGWRLRLVGAGPEEAALREQVTRAGLDTAVTITGAISDDQLWGEYRRASIFALPAVDDPDGFEGLGIVLLEAAAFGLPLVGFAGGGIPELIHDGENGLLVPAADVAALAAALGRLADAPELRRRFGLAARAAARNYSWAANARQLRQWLGVN